MSTTKTPDLPSQFLTVRDVAKMLQVCEETVYRHALGMGAVKVGRALRFRARDVEAWADSRQLGGAA